MYKVVKDFRDLIDGHFYHAGDTFPRMGASVDDDRIKELSTTANKAKAVLIKFVEDKEKEKGKRKNARANIESDKKLLHS